MSRDNAGRLFLPLDLFLSLRTHTLARKLGFTTQIETIGGGKERASTFLFQIVARVSFVGKTTAGSSCNKSSAQSPFLLRDPLCDYRRVLRKILIYLEQKEHLGEREGKGMERGPNTGLELSTLFFGACLLAWFLARGGTRTKRDKKAQPTLK